MAHESTGESRAFTRDDIHIFNSFFQEKERNEIAELYCQTDAFRLYEPPSGPTDKSFLHQALEKSPKQ
jgi:hypothetical protein